MATSEEPSAMELDTGSVRGNQELQLPWVEKYRPKRCVDNKDEILFITVGLPCCLHS